jgi:hypothetical protein
MEFVYAILLHGTTCASCNEVEIKSTTPGFSQAVVSEFYNVATSNAFDGSVKAVSFSSARRTGTDNQHPMMLFR